MTRTVCALMFSAFALANVQSSYAMDIVEETNEIPTPVFMARSLTSERSSEERKRWTPQAPVKEESKLHKIWLRKAQANPDQYRVRGTTPWIFQ